MSVAQERELLELMERIHNFLKEHELRRPRKLTGGPVTLEPSLTPEPSRNEGVVAGQYQQVIDETLVLVYTSHYRLISRLYPTVFFRLTLEQLRGGPLGEDLMRLARIASGPETADKNEVLGAIDSVLQLLFWPVGAETYTVPRSFWEHPLGRMLSRAKLRSYKPEELISVGAAAKVLGVTRPTIYRWMDEKALDYVRDDVSGRTFIAREDVEAMKADIQAHEAGRTHSDLRPENAVLPGNVKSTLIDYDNLNYDNVARTIRADVVALRHILGRLVDEPEPVSPDHEPTALRLRITEEPLTASTVDNVISALTTLHTKCWLLYHDRLADLIDYTQTRTPRFEQEAHLIITRMRYNSPLDIKVDVGIDKVGDAIQKSIDALVQVRQRHRKQELENEAAEVETKLKEQAAQSALADQDQERQLAAWKAEVELQGAQLEIKRKQLVLQEQELAYERDRVRIAVETGMQIVERVRPDITDPATKAMLAQSFVREFLQFGSIQNVELVPLEPAEKPAILPEGDPPA